MKRSIRFQVKFNFTLHIQLIFQLVQKRINWLLSNGTNLRQTLRPDFTAKPMMMMMKDAMLSFERTSGPFAVERYETTKKIKFLFISQKCSKYYNLSRFHINSFFIFFGVSYL